MKLLLFTSVATLLFAVVLCQADQNAKHDKCKKEAGVDANHIFKSIDDEANNKEFKCFLKCLLVDMGGMNAMGELVAEKLKLEATEAKPEVWAQLVDACKSVTDDDQCEKAYKFTKCISHPQ